MTGSVLHRNLLVPSDWTTEVDGVLTQPAGTGPWGDPIIRSTLVDGQNSNPGTGQTGVERNDMRAGDIPLGAERCFIWGERFVQLVDTSIDSWQLISACEVHGTSTADQAPFMLQVWSDKHRRLNTNAGRDPARYTDLGLITPMEWVQYRLDIKYSNGSDAYLRLWRNGVVVKEYLDEPTTVENSDGVWKLGHYRNAAINGTSIYEISGARIYRKGNL